MNNMITTLDLSAGDYVMRHGSSALVQVAEIREPRHPAMPGLVVDVHYYRPDERAYSPYTRPIHATDPTVPKWIRVPDDALPTMPDERYDVPTGMHAWRYGDEITVRQVRRWTEGPLWQTDARGMTRIAKDAENTTTGRSDRRVTCVSSSVFGVGGREIWERRYKI